MMKGYRPQVDWGGEGGSATIVVGTRNVKVATAGWRRRCLYIFLFSLLIISIMNLIVTLWILTKISFNAEGAGDLQVLVGGLKLDGNFFLNHEFTVGNIRSQYGEDLNLSGFNNFTLVSVDEDGNSLFSLDPSVVTSTAKSFKVLDNKGLVLFAVNEDDTKVGAKYFTVTGNNGADFEGSMQTPRLLGNANEFRIESKTRTVKGRAGKLLRVEARDGDVNVISFKDIKLKSNSGQIRFESSNIYISHLESFGEVNPVTSSTLETQIEPPTKNPLPTQPYVNDKVNEENTDNRDISVYQVCVCPNGKLFLAPAVNSTCENDPLSCLQ